MVMPKLNRFFVWLVGLMPFAACTEDITLEAPQYKHVPVVEGYLTDEYKRHEVILSYTAPLYDTVREMISGAKVYAATGNDTIYYYEQPDNPGHYLTDSVAGKKRHWYRFEASIPSSISHSGSFRMYADAYLPNNVDHIDSLKLLPLLNEQGLPFVDESAAICICPYFQTLSATNIVYKVDLYLNGHHFKNRPSELFQLFPMGGYAGCYFNGPEMLQNNVEVPVGIMNKVYMHDGYTVGLKLSSITRDYMYFLYEQKLSIGVNPIMGAYQTTASNIFSNCDAVGWFCTTSVVYAEAIYDDSIFEQ